MTMTPMADKQRPATNLDLPMDPRDTNHEGKKAKKVRRWQRRRGPLTSAPDPAAIEIQQVQHSFGAVEVLTDFTLTIEPTSSVGIVGPSGCGKSTLLRLIAGLADPSSGHISIGGDADSRGRLSHCALMPQRDLLLPWRSALDNACLALENRGVPRSEARSRARPLFERLGLASFEKSLPEELSGGMRQRVSFLRTLLADKGVLLLDEPFGALDAITRAEMQDWLLSAIREEPRTTVLITHDVEEALLLSETVVVLSARPAQTVRTVHVELDKRLPRLAVISDPRFIELKHDVLEALGW